MNQKNSANNPKITHQKQVKLLLETLKNNRRRLKVKKKTISNLFRYDGRQVSQKRLVDLSNFNQPLFLDEKNQTLEVQGLATFETIVNYVLPHGFLPLITPELKHITIGGATVGIGIETNSFRHGFVHDGLLEADVLLPHGEVVTCRADNTYADLFQALPNSYGSLGYILRAKIKLHRVSPYVQLTTKKYSSVKKLLQDMRVASQDSKNDYLESLSYSANELYLTTVRHVEAPKKLRSIYGGTIFYKDISRAGEFCLSTKDYIFRYDPEWFWSMPDTGFYNLFRRVAPKKIRNSSFYARYMAWQEKLPFVKTKPDDLEFLIQDWEVPFDQAEVLLNFAFKNLDLAGRPLMSAPLVSSFNATNYPIKNNQLYFNLGSYSFVKKRPDKPAYYTTKIMDEFTFKHGGIKMLYSTTFLQQKEFDRLYNQKPYKKLKQSYDPHNLLPTLYEKTVNAQ